MITVGIDWGTQSSKWFWMNPDHQQFGRIHSSTLWRDRQSNTIVFPDDDTFRPIGFGPDFTKAEKLKRVLIHDPHSSFWEGKRTDSGMSLGNSIVLSICSLLRAVWDSLPSTATGDIGEVCFSFPNWLPRSNPEHDQALVKFRKAVRLSIRLFLSDRLVVASPGSPNEISRFEDAVDSILDGWEPQAVNTEAIAHIADDIEGLRIKYVPESIAAGLPYLLNYEKEGKSTGRFLIVDVGAGSTDVSYLDLWRLEGKAASHFVYYPPAPAIPLAGGDITNALRDQDRIDEAEAEVKKIALSNRNGLSAHLPYLELEWTPRICSRVQQYVAGTRRHANMRQGLPINLIVSGGSGSVEGLAGSLVDCVNAGIQQNRNEIHTNECVLISPLLFSDRDVVETGRRVVSIGAGQAQKNRLIFLRPEDVTPQVGSEENI